MTGQGNTIPGITAVVTAEFRRVFKIYDRMNLPGGGYIDGAKSRDLSNTGYTTGLQAGLIMGKVTATNRYAPFIIGTLQGAAIATATSITVTAAEAAELVRRVGPTGTITLIGPPTAAGVVAVFTETYSNVNVGTGVITCSGLDAALIAGSWVCDTDGSQTPKNFIPDGYPVKLTDQFGNVNAVTAFPAIPISGLVESSRLIGYPADASMRTWLKQRLSTLDGAKFMFDDSL